MRNKDKAILDALGERYDIIEHDGGYCLYDKERPAQRMNHKYIGKFYISSDKKRYVFNEKYYNDVGGMVEAMDAYNSTLPFDIEVYCPLFRDSFRIECALHDYLGSLGFERNWGSDVYVLHDCYGQTICELSTYVKSGTTKGVITRHIVTPDKSKRFSTDSPFADLDSAIASVNTILATYVASVNAVTMNVLNKITNSRSALLLNSTFDARTLSKFTEDGREKMIEVLEKELDQLKGIKNEEKLCKQQP